MDFSAGKSGIAEDQTSKRQARRVALKQCGTKNCKVISEGVNTCLATAYGAGGHGFGAGETEQIAMQDAMNICQKGGYTCAPRYVHCNLPVRIQ